MVLDCPFDFATLLLRKVSLPQPFLVAVDGLISDLDVLFVLSRSALILWAASAAFPSAYDLFKTSVKSSVVTKRVILFSDTKRSAYRYFTDPHGVLLVSKKSVFRFGPHK